MVICLKSCRLSDYVTRWFNSYFNRTQEVRLNNVVSMSLSISTRIGQGTLPGPLIFISYVNDVIKNVSGLRVNMYADDCLIHMIGNNKKRMVPKIQDGLDNFHNWCSDNCLKHTVQKTKSLVIGTRYYKMTGLDIANRFKLDGITFQNA